MRFDARATQEQHDELTALSDTLIQALQTKTPAQVATWIDVNVTDLASAKTVLKALAKIIVIVVRRMQ